MLAQAAPLEHWQRLPFPVLISYGQHDIYGDSRRLVQERFPGASLVEIAGAGHVPWVHNPAAFAAVLADFYRLPVSASNRGQRH
jgi:proline iminopeptidase